MTHSFTPCPKPPARPPKPRRPIARVAALPKATRPIARVVPVKKRNAKRGGHRFPHNVNEPLREWIREQACCITGLYTGDVMTLPDGTTIKVVVQVTHIKSRNSGGPDASNVVPMNQWHHHRLDQVDGPETFAAKHSVDLPTLAAAYWAVWQDLQVPAMDDTGAAR